MVDSIEGEIFVWEFCIPSEGSVCSMKYLSIPFKLYIF